MTATERREAERDSMLYHNRDYQRVHEQSADDGSLAVIFTRPELAPRCFLLAFAGTAGKPPRPTTRTGPSRPPRRPRRSSWPGAGATPSESGSTGRSGPGSARLSKPGAVLVSSWGYDQTNVDYYQVIGASDSGRSVTIRPIAARQTQEGWLTGSCWPLADHFVGEPSQHRVGPGDSVKVRDWGVWARPWVPEPDRWSAYA